MARRRRQTKRTPERNASGCLSEREEQVRLMSWARIMERTHPEFEFIYAVPNGGFRTARTGAKMKQEGQKPGVPDLVWPIARREHHGLYLELKATKNGRTSPHQKKWLDFLKRQGYRAVVAKGFDIAQAEIMWYAGLSERKSEAIEIDLEKKK